jgi:hypothetical protein
MSMAYVAACGNINIEMAKMSAASISINVVISINGEMKYVKMNSGNINGSIWRNGAG